MGYRMMGWLHAAALDLRDGQRGQGTVEYVGLILLIAGVIAGVVAVGSTLKGGGIAQQVVEKLKDAIDGVGATKKGG